MEIDCATERADILNRLLGEGFLTSDIGRPIGLNKI
jgi:hypothetical protein